MRSFRRNKSARPGTLRGADPADFAHLEQFAQSRRGVEAYVAATGYPARMREWTRKQKLS